MTHRVCVLASQRRKVFGGSTAWMSENPKPWQPAKYVQKTANPKALNPKISEKKAKCNKGQHKDKIIADVTTCSGSKKSCRVWKTLR